MSLKCFLDCLHLCKGITVHNIFVPVHLDYAFIGEVYRCLDDKEISSFFSDHVEKIEFYHCCDSADCLVDIYLIEHDYSFQLKHI